MDLEEASSQVRAKVLRDFAFFVIGSTKGFGKSVGDRIQVKSLGYRLPTTQAIATCEIEVTEDMLDQSGDFIHNGCIAYLMDMCTALPFILLFEVEASISRSESKFAMTPFAPSQRLDLVFLNPAKLGTRLRILGKTITHVGSALLVSGEIWDSDHDRMVAYATHFKVMPKKPPPVVSTLKL